MKLFSCELRAGEMGKEKEVVVGRKGRFHSGGDKKGLEATSSTTFADVQG